MMKRNRQKKGEKKFKKNENGLLNHFIHVQCKIMPHTLKFHPKVKVTFGKSCCFLPVVLKYLTSRFYFYFFPWEMCPTLRYPTQSINWCGLRCKKDISLHRTYLIQCISLGQRESPSCFECPPHHGTGCSGCGTGQAKWILKLQSTEFDTDINQVDWGEELREFGLFRDW
jgi:hypothetical protein